MMETVMIEGNRAAISLATAVSGQFVKIHSIPGGLVQAQFLRFGIGEGERVQCIERLPGGTIVLQKNRQQIAIGHTLARQIIVMVIDLPQE